MSAPTMVEMFDMPMIDYNEDGDIPMVGSSTENWFQPLSHMDEDAHHVDPSDPLEVDMMAYEETTTEYEMEDDAAQLQETTLDTNVVDAEVYDVTIQSSPLPTAPAEIVENYVVQAGTTEAAGAIPGQPQVDEGPHLTMTHDSDTAATQTFTVSDAAPSHDTLSVASDAQHSDYASVPEVVEHDHEHHLDEPGHAEGSPLISLRPSEEVANTVEDHSSTISEVPAPPSHFENPEEHPNDEHHDEPPDPSSDLAHENEETVVSEYPEDEEVSRGLPTEEGEGTSGAVDDAAEQPVPHTDQQAYIQPPPPIFLALQVTSTEGDQPDFVLFNSPESSSHATEEPLVLLQHHPSLFYEPISAVFEAFRQEEYFSHLEELSEAEMALNAHELQLVISEDNIYAREVSLHDLHAMHQGVGLPGHLRLTLQSVVPRFIARYNVLRDQITRLVLTDESEETQQHAVGVTDEEASAESIVPQQELEQETQNLLAIEESENAEGTDQLREDDDHDGLQHNEDASNETEEDDDQDGQNTAPVVSEHVDVERDGQATHESDNDDFGENDDTVDILDADAVHANTPEDVAEPTFEEHAPEYTDVAEPHEEGGDGYGNDFKDDEADGTGTAGDADASAVPSEDNRSETYVNEEQQDSVPELDGVQPGVISHSTSTSSFGTNDSSWEGEVEEVDASPDLKQETDHSIQQTTAIAFDEEGNFTDGVEGGDDEFGDDDDFGVDGFDDSAEGTLEDPTEETEELADNVDTSDELEKNADAASQAVLAESEKFVLDLENGSDNLEIAIEKAAKIKNTRSQGLESGSSSHSTVIETVSEKPKAIHKNSSKRSLDDAELDNEGFVSPPSSPDSKRTRTL